MIRVKIKQTCRRLSKTMLQKLPPRNPFWSFLSKLNAKKKKNQLNCSVFITTTSTDATSA